MFDTNVHQLECKYYCNGTPEFQTFKKYIQSTEQTNHLRTLPNVPNNIPLHILNKGDDEAQNVSEIDTTSDDMSFAEHENKSGWKDKLKTKTRRIVSNNAFMRSIHSFMDTCGLMERKQKPNLQLSERNFEPNSNELLLLQPNTSTAEYSDEFIFQKYYQPYFEERQIYAVKNKKIKRKHTKISHEAPEINSLNISEPSEKRTPSTVTIKSLSKRQSNDSFYDLHKYKSEQPDVSARISSSIANRTVCPGPCVEPLTISRSFKKLPTIENSQHMPAIRQRSAEDDINNYWSKRHLASLESIDPKKRKKRWCKKKAPLLEIRKTKENNESKGDSKQSLFNQSLVKESDTDDSTGCIKMGRDGGKQTCSKYKHESNLTIKSFPGIDIAPCSTTCNLQDSVGINTKKVKYHNKKTATSHKRTSEHDPMILLDKSCRVYPSNVEKMPMQFKKPITQPVLGYCSMNRRETKGIQYALAKITHFTDYTTYEIMAPYKSPPKDTPTCIAEIFVLSRQQKLLSMHLKK